MIALTASTNPAPEPFQKMCRDSGVEAFASYHLDPFVSVIHAYQKLWETYKDDSVLVYMHDDVTIHDSNWLERILLELMDPKVAIVGLGGGTGIGVDDIYKTPYRIEQLIRTSYVSNQDDWQVHGGHETGEKRVAVVDGFLMAMKGSFLREVGGWNWIDSNFHCYDTAMCLEAYRRGWEVRMVGVSCHHQGGGTSTKPEYKEWCDEHATTMEEEHRNPHRWLYERYRDMLPLRIR